MPTDRAMIENRNFAETETRIAELINANSAEVERRRLAERRIADLECQLSIKNAEVDRLNTLINKPELFDFDRGIVLECAHHVHRWGEAHDRSKSAENWFWLIGYLAGKALRAAIVGEKEMALHHTISAAAALRNWHAAIIADQSGQGLGQDSDLAPLATQSDQKSATPAHPRSATVAVCPLKRVPTDLVPNGDEA